MSESSKRNKAIRALRDKAHELMREYVEFWTKHMRPCFLSKNDPVLKAMSETCESVAGLWENLNPTGFLNPPAPPKPRRPVKKNTPYVDPGYVACTPHLARNEGWNEGWNECCDAHDKWLDEQGIGK